MWRSSCFRSRSGCASLSYSDLDYPELHILFLVHGPQRQLVCGVHVVVVGVAVVHGVLLPRKIHKDLENQQAKTELRGTSELEN